MSHFVPPISKHFYYHIIIIHGFQDKICCIFKFFLYNIIGNLFQIATYFLAILLSARERSDYMHKGAIMADETMTGSQVQDDDAVMYTERKRILFLGLPWTFTKYTITPSLLTIDRGLLNTIEDDCYMYKIQDVKLTTSLLERIVGCATVICYTGDVTDKEIKLVHIKHAKEIKAYLLKASEAARIKRRTLNTVDIGARDIDDELDTM